MEHQVKEVKINTTLHSINHCQKWKFFQNSSNFFGLWWTNPEATRPTPFEWQSYKLILLFELRQAMHIPSHFLNLHRCKHHHLAHAQT